MAGDRTNHYQPVCWRFGPDPRVALCPGQESFETVSQYWRSGGGKNLDVLRRLTGAAARLEWAPRPDTRGLWEMAEKLWSCLPIRSRSAETRPSTQSRSDCAGSSAAAATWQRDLPR